MEQSPTHIIAEKKEWFEVKFPYRRIMVDLIKHHFPTRRFDPVSKTFRINKAHRNELVAFAQKHKFHFVDTDTQLQNWKDFPALPQLQLNELDYIKRKLFPFQGEGVAFQLDRKGAMCGDDMGLGKTTQSIATVSIANAFPSLVICPSSLKLNWQEEWQIVAGKRSVIMDDSIRRTWGNIWSQMNIGVFICNYEGLRKYFIDSVVTDKNGNIVKIVVNERAKMFKSIIIDEAHRIKDHSTQQSKYAEAIAQHPEYKLLLSGTFVVNDPKDLLVPLRITGALKSEFGGQKNFLDTFYPGGRAQNLPELAYRLRKSCFYMRMKKDVLKDLPDKTRQVIHCELSNRKEYEKAERNFMQFLEESGKTSEQITNAMRAEALVQIGVLKKLSGKGKIDALLEYAQEIISAGKKVIIFCWHIEMVALVAESIKGAVRLTGEESIEARQENKNRFQKDPQVPAIVLNFQAGAVGHTLTAASTVLFLEFGWNPMHHDQAEDRAYRIGVKDNVHCVYFAGSNTIDNHIYGIIEKKREIVQAISAGGDDIQTSVLDDLINIYKK
ncbi:DEAD/DEAH box helicase [Chitinophaga sancti]|uniref:DEAD/DEAH box helicase n=1 Tax=Chitinophaga sancti TaxID=1004 RepID=A0A1K1M089_9BACT|nr:DEAD/DEAH box helicase [Chitinophaga sancti]WQD64723.1 DEAD/DEAH box helicase [Chitinophaga sancti]WQG89655.1 DEAD/DEAH box helicase [Chitinophaga sancti]SFW16546.1 SWI/SNF-related matrix-associated actin-dependent regulator of chromatin subfamily A-like protein 1 [Chitinophaga sancti]